MTLALLPAVLAVAAGVLGVGLAVTAALIVFVGAFGVVGALLAVHHPRNPAGWVFVLMGAGIAFEEAALAYAAAGHPGARWGVWAVDWTWVFGLAGMLVVLPLTFPDGRLPSRRWRWVLVAAGLGVAGFVVGNALYPGPVGDMDAALRIDNPAGWSAGAGLLEALRVGGAVLLAGSAVAAAVSAVRRYRAARGIERAQLRWFAAAAVLLVAALAVMAVLHESGYLRAAQLVIGLSALALPAAVAVAVFRYRLYDIDRLISRTVSYALLSALLAAVYLAAVVALQVLARPLIGETDLAVAGATLAAAAVVAPARRRIQVRVDRRFNRARYDAEHAVRAFRERLRADIDLDGLCEDFRATATTTLEPAAVTVWLRPPATDAARSSAPANGVRRGTVTLPERRPPTPGKQEPTRPSGRRRR